MSIAHPSEPRKLRRNSLKEEMVALTEDTIDALLLNQLIKYQAMSRDREKFIEEEKKRLQHYGQAPNVYNERGWFYKTTAELIEESMISLAESTVNTRIDRFEARGWLTKRKNLIDAWDKKTYYRVHVVEIDRQMLEIGYFLSGWLIHRINPLRPSTEDEYSESKTRNSETETRNSVSEFRVSETEVRSSDSERLASTPLTSTFKQDVENKQQQHGDVDVDDDGSSLSKDTERRVASEPSTPPIPRTESESLSAASQAPELLSRLLTLGVVKADLGKGEKRVAGALTMVQVCPDIVRAWLDWLPDAMLDMEEAGTPVTNVGGFLAHCIRNGMPMPARTKARIEAEGRAARCAVGGAGAHCARADRSPDQHPPGRAREGGQQCRGAPGHAAHLAARVAGAGPPVRAWTAP